jgi:O-ureido-D-serine cyclo-ligase
VLVPKGSGVSLQAVMKKKHWFRGVVKPAVGAGSFLTRVCGGGDDDEQFFAASLVERDMLVQPFMAEVEHSGERALVYIDGAVTHAVRKAPRFSADGESTTPVVIADDERTLAERVLHWTMRTFPCGALLYGRVDIVRDAEGAPRIMELELTEPSLFLQYSEAAVSRFVDAIERRLALLPNHGDK